MNWLGLNWLDIAISVAALALIPGFVAAWGGHLAAEAIQDARRSRKVKFWFWFLFVLGVIITFWQQYRVAVADQSRDTRETWADALLTREFSRTSFPPESAYQKTRKIPVMEPLDVRGEKLCHEILDFAREAEQEEPTCFGSPSTPRDALDAMTLNRKNIDARISADFDKRFGGPLASITKEFAAKGITPDVTMIQPPNTIEIHLGGKALCAMVYTLRQKEGIPDPQMAERAQTYRTASRPCSGDPAGTDDPFPADRADQVGIRAIDMANLIESKADACINTMRAGRVDNDGVRRSYASDIRHCCLETSRRFIIQYSADARPQGTPWAK